MKQVRIAFISFVLFIVSSLSSGVTEREIDHLISKLIFLKATANLLVVHPYTNSINRGWATGEILVFNSYLNQLKEKSVSQDRYNAINDITNDDIAVFSEIIKAWEINLAASSHQIHPLKISE